MTTEIKLTDEQCDALGIERGSEVISYKTSSNHTLSVHPPKPKPKHWYPDYWLLTNEHKKHIRVTRTLLAYVAEFDDDWEADWSNEDQEKWFAFYDNGRFIWDIDFELSKKIAGVVYMSDQCATGLLEKLSSGEVDLNG